LQQLWYIILRNYVWLGLHVYFRKIIVQGSRNIPEGPVIFAANHQNAFLDALMIVCFNRHTTHFLSRADIFKKPFTRWVLSTLNMFPIYRIRDGWKSLSENKSTFDYCHHLFLRNEAVVIFPEGNHGARRNLRPLSKGFTRMASESLQRSPEMKIHIVPVGLNYSDHNAFRSSVSVLFGAPMLANLYVNREGLLEAGKLKDDVEEEMKKLVTHIKNDDYETTIRQLEQTIPDYLDPVDTNRRLSRIENGETIAAAAVRNSSNKEMLLPFQWTSRMINYFPLFFWRKI
jgi:1-acyl-sn-glycerol-3-phosphate acyltransferase